MPLLSYTFADADWKKLLPEIQRLSSLQNYESIWQSPSWASMLLKTGYASECFFVAQEENGSLLAFAIIEKRSIGLGQFGLFVIGGPIGDALLLMEALSSLCKQEKCLFIQIEPLEGLADAPKNWIRTACKKFIEPTTVMIDLTKTDDEILANMKPKGRYNIKVAQKHEIQTEWAEPTEANIDRFHELMSETTKRDGFATNTRSYFATLLDYLHQEKIGGLLFAKKEDDLIAGGIFCYFGKTALYYYGASVSDPEKRKFMASYLLQWEAIQEGKRRGCLWYDFL